MSQETIQHTFAVTSPVSMKLNNISGSVDIQAGEDGVIHVMAIKKANGGDENETKVECLQAEDGSVSIATRFPDLNLNWLLGSKACDVDYTVKAPRQASLVVNGVSHSLHVSGFEGDLKFKTVSGDMSLDRLSGSLKVDTVSGDVTGQLISGKCQIKTVSGDVNLRDSSLEAANFNTVSGDVILQTGLSIGPYTSHTVSGDVHLEIPGLTNCNVELHSLSGNFSTNLPVRQSSGSHGMQTAVLGTGGVNVSLKSISGDLVLESDGKIPQEVNNDTLEILTRLEKGELSVDEALHQISG
jgi:hypothetical protein